MGRKEKTAASPIMTCRFYLSGTSDTSAPSGEGLTHEGKFPPTSASSTSLNSLMEFEDMIPQSDDERSIKSVASYTEDYPVKRGPSRPPGKFANLRQRKEAEEEAVKRALDKSTLLPFPNKSIRIFGVNCEKEMEEDPTADIAARSLEQVRAILRVAACPKNLRGKCQKELKEKATP